jgi:hypothetical protein
MMKLRNIGYATFIAATAATLLIGSVGASDAKSKKKMTAPPPQPGPCFEVYAPVCGAKGGMKFTYANSCFAEKDGASVVSHGACPVKKAMKHHKKHSKKKMAKPMKKEKKT